MPWITTHLDLGIAGEVECDIEYEYSPGRPAVMYLSNGDPGYPEEPAEFYVCKVKAKGIDITSLVEDQLQDDDSLIELINEIYNDKDY